MPATSAVPPSSEDDLATGLLAALAGVAIPVAEPAPRGAKRKAPKVRGRRVETGKYFTIGIGENGHIYLTEFTQPVEIDPSDAHAQVGHHLATFIKNNLIAKLAPADAATLDPATVELAQVIGRTLPAARQKASEAAVEKMVEALVETQDPLAQVNGRIDAMNAAARHRFINDFLTYTAADVAREAGSTARNRHQTASRWKAERAIFSVPFQGLDRFPAFQFSHGQPLPVIADILRHLPDAMSPWEIAFWFVSTNGWLGGEAPVTCLGDSDRVIEAARLEGEAIIG